MATAPPSLPLTDAASTRRLTNAADVARALGDLAMRERAIDARLESLLTGRADVERALAKLGDETGEALSSLRADGTQLAASINGTAALAERVSRKVRQLDTAQSRVRETLTHIDAAVGRAEAVDGLRAALAADDYEGAAQRVAAFRDLEARFVSDGSAGDDRQLREQHEAVTITRDKLLTVVRDRLETASHAGDHEGVVRFVRLHKPLGVQADGLAWFATYLRKLVADRAVEAYNVLLEAQNRSGADFVTALTDLFCDIGGALDANRSVVADTYGALAVLDLARALHEECDAHGARILQRYCEHRRLRQLVAAAVAAASPDKARPADADPAAARADPRQVEEYLEEVLVLYQRCEEYNAYLLAAMTAAVAPDPLGTAREQAVRSGEFNVTVRELVSNYINLEEYYLEQNVRTAIEIDEYTPGAPLTSMVDDVFFIVQKCGRRALATCNVQCACAVLGAGNGLLNSEVTAGLDAKWKTAASRLTQLLGTALDTEADVADEAAQPAAILNDVDACAQYASKLKADFDMFASEVFASAGDLDRVRSILADMNKTTADFEAIVAKEIEQLSNGFMPRIRPAMDEAASVSYQLTEAAYSANELGETWVQRMLAVLMACFGFVQPLLAPTLHDTLIDNVLDKVVDRLEALLRLKRFNQLGGLQLDRDVRTLVSSLADVTARSVRDKFARLSQIATILSLETVAEMKEFWGADAAISWRLTETEVREVLSQRFDFDQAEIALLSL